MATRRFAAGEVDDQLAQVRFMTTSKALSGTGSSLLSSRNQRFGATVRCEMVRKLQQLFQVELLSATISAVCRARV
jgi:hypothetical protein